MGKVEVRRSCGNMFITAFVGEDRPRMFGPEVGEGGVGPWDGLGRVVVILGAGRMSLEADWELFGAFRDCKRIALGGIDT